MNKQSFIFGPDENNRSVYIKNNRISAWSTLGKTPLIQKDIKALDCSGCLIGPGDINAHTHLYSGLAPLGLPAPKNTPENFVQILERLWWRLDRALDEKSLRASARYYLANALLSGTTSVIDHHESPNFIEGSLDLLANAYQDLGVRGIICFGATERNEGRDEASRGLKECERFLKENDRPLVKAMIALHASFTVSDETIAQAAELCERYDAKMHVHMAEDAADVADAKKRGYQSPLDRLEKLGALPPGSILAHCIHLTEEELAHITELGCWIVQNPRSNKNNNVGYNRFLYQSDRVALGTDGFASKMNEEFVALVEDAARYRERLCEVTRRPEKGRSIIEEFFNIKVDGQAGSTADIVAYKTDEADVRAKHLIVDGKLIVEDSKLLSADYESIVAEAKEEAEKLWPRMLAYPE